MSATSMEGSLSRHVRKCPICEAGCGVVVTVDREKRTVLDIRGDEHDPLSRGFVCPKSQGMKVLREDRDVLTKPLRRRGKHFEEISWQDAFELAAERFKDISHKYGADANAIYVGNPTAHNPGALLYTLSCAMALGTRSLYSSTSVDHLPKVLSTGLIFGDQSLIPVPDVERTDYLLILGANPCISGGSLMTAPGFGRRMEEIRQRGGQVVVVDPRRTETAALANRHLSIRPGTDPYFLLGLLRVLFDEDLVKLGRLETHVNGVQEVAALARSFSLPELAAASGIPAETIREIARDFAGAPSAVCYGRTGSSQQPFGSVTSWLIDVVNALTGNLDRPGGAMIPMGVTPSIFLNERYRNGVAPHHRWHSRVRGLPEVAGQLPAVVLAEEILTPGQGQIRGLLTMCANPVISVPNGPQLSKALSSLDFMVAVDIYVGETSRHADLILPGSGHLDRSDWPIFTTTLAVRHVAKWVDKVFEPIPGTKSDGEIMLSLAARLSDTSEEAVDNALAGFFLQGAQAGGGLGGKTAAQALGLLEEKQGSDRIYEILLRTHHFGDKFGAKPDGLTLSKVKAADHGIDLGPLFERLPQALGTPSGKVELAPELLMREAPRLREAMTQYTTSDRMIMIGRRQLHSINSWMHNIRAFNRGPDKCTAMLHPNDAERLHVKTGDRVEISRNDKMITVPVTVSDEIMPGVISMPHGWGHDAPDARLSYARTRPGVNSNLVASEFDIDIPSGNAVLTGFTVGVARAAAVPAPTLNVA
ncbi:molybdopterin-dependent oxidoreductase [Paraburkholderia madseniana]|uniref:molybdopterin-dependent oxidoreductase n=1 Tax=Paraburkholderia madseniana TaxID=2599607 RepID=UPI0038B9DC54